VLQLDDLYMSHSKITGAVPNSVSNTVHGKGGGRTSLVLDQELLKHCALKTDLTDVNALCVTTRDWDSDSVRYIDRVVRHSSCTRSTPRMTQQASAQTWRG
jgi:hypothetical protein